MLSLLAGPSGLVIGGAPPRRLARVSRAGVPRAGVDLLGSTAEFDAALAATDDEALLCLMTSSANCGPCAMLEPKFEYLSTVYTDYAFFELKCDSSEEAKALAGKLKVEATPSVHVFKKGGDVRKDICKAGLSSLDLIEIIEDVKWAK